MLKIQKNHCSQILTIFWEAKDNKQSQIKKLKEIEKVISLTKKMKKNISLLLKDEVHYLQINKHLLLLKDCLKKIHIKMYIIMRLKTKIKYKKNSLRDKKDRKKNKMMKFSIQ